MLNSTSGDRLTCPDCGFDSVETRHELHPFEYGPPGQVATLSASVPVHYCRNPDCEEAFLGEEAMMLRHEAICVHLGILTPLKIRELRLKKAGAATAFAQVTGIGTATLQRWESGAQLQSKSQDNFLRLLAIGENYSVLEEMKAGKKISSTAHTTPSKFRSISDQGQLDTLTAQQGVFELRQRRSA